MFLVVPIVSTGENRGKELEPVSVNMDEVADYREWKDEEDVKKTVFFFKKDTGKGKLIAKIDVKKVHEAIGAIILS